MAAPATRPLTVLNVDGYAPMRYARSRALRRAGARVREASNGAEALRSVAEERPDLAIVSVALADISGFDLCRRIKSDTANAGIAIVHPTDCYDPEEFHQASLDGSQGYVEEPVDWAALVENVRGLVARSQRASAEVSRLCQQLARDFGDLMATQQRSRQILNEPPAGFFGVGGETGVCLRVLVIDDEALVRDVTKAILEHYGYSVLTAPNGARALELFRERGAEIGLVLLDWWMPEMDGEATLSGLQRMRPDLPVIVISGLDRVREVLAVSRSRNIGFLAKPYVMDQVLRAVRAVAPKLNPGATRKRR